MEFRRPVTIGITSASQWSEVGHPAGTMPWLVSFSDEGLGIYCSGTRGVRDERASANEIYQHRRSVGGNPERRLARNHSQATSATARGVAMRRILIVLLFALSATATIVLAHPQSASAATHTVAIDGAPNCGTSKFCYSPSSLTVTVGDTVTWVNNSTAPHTVTRCASIHVLWERTGSGGQSGPSSPTINASGGTFTFTFTRPGKYKYYSAIHGHAMLHGKITVVAATTTPTASTTSTTVPSSRRSPETRAATTRQSAEASTYTVAIDGTPNCGTSMFCYNPSSLTVNAGDTVTWVNNSTAPHTVTRCDPSTCSGNGPGSGGQSGPSSPTINASGGTFSFTFTSPGTYTYFCAIYGYAMMHGNDHGRPGYDADHRRHDLDNGRLRFYDRDDGRSAIGNFRPILEFARRCASANQLAGTGAPTSQGVALGLVLLLLGLGLTAASTARRRPNAERPSVAAPESSLTIRSTRGLRGGMIGGDPKTNAARDSRWAACGWG